jgi:hypothetical protein
MHLRRAGAGGCALQGDDYILYCHPSRQKTPRSEHLREWYLRMLRVAQEEGSVTHLSNLYDTFFEGGRDHRLPAPSASHMPYFEGARAAGKTLHFINQFFYIFKKPLKKKDIKKKVTSTFLIFNF